MVFLAHMFDRHIVECLLDVYRLYQVARHQGCQHSYRLVYDLCDVADSQALENEPAQHHHGQDFERGIVGVGHRVSAGNQEISSRSGRQVVHIKVFFRGEDFP